MAWTSVKDWGAGEVLTAEDMDTYVSDNTDYLYDYKPTSEQWINNGTSVAQLNQRIESGTGFAYFNKSSLEYVPITYNTAFGTAPRIVATGLTTGLMCICTNNGTGVGTMQIRIITGGTVQGSQYFNWMAIGA